MLRPRFNLSTAYLKARVIATDAAGCKYDTWPNVTATISADIQPASGEAQAKQYGVKLDYLLNMYYYGSATITEADGVCVYVASSASPDYKVKSIKPWPGYKAIVLEKVG